MNKRYHFVNPELDPARGRTRELIQELDELWTAGKNEGAGEVLAAMHALSDSADVAFTFKMIEGSPTVDLLRDFVKLVSSSDWKKNALFMRVLEKRPGKTQNLDAVAVASATGGLHAALVALGARGGEVIAASLNYPGVTNAIALAGATPRFVEIDSKTWCMDPDAARAAVGENTRAILLTHMNHFADLGPFYDICEGGKRNIPLVQDASLAVGSMREGLRPGLLNIGAPGVTVASLTISKIISGIGGAVVLSDSHDLIERVHAFAHQGLDPRSECIQQDFGANYKMSSINAAIARAMLGRFDSIVGRRRELRLRFDAALAPLVSDGLIELQALTPDDTVTHYGILLPEGVDWSPFATGLYERHNIITGRWLCAHQERPFKKSFGRPGERLDVTEAVGRRLLFLPFHAGLAEGDADFICEKFSEEVRAAASRRRKA